MTGLALLVIVVCAALVLRQGVRRMRAGMAAERERLEAFRASLGIPDDRCQIVDVGVVEALLDLLIPSRLPPRFEQVWRQPAEPPVTWEEVIAGERA